VKVRRWYSLHIPIPDFICELVPYKIFSAFFGREYFGEGTYSSILKSSDLFYQLKPDPLGQVGELRLSQQ
jgi:hypothetical protein